ncbi:extracellular solute-binding protein [Paenarthrobacter sp. Z7-10]|uniref:ABC transporter substrate-binding protein n=1 Tax=Paenarthrobacter sp. Z7-10 TaxID=2787635 RepID=UPI0022A94BAA|nr:extracellular solute-binding protein [Paenarthrobacter sp. Z7-10]MCZ2402452.1 extracellular solute-binding protein [Paenarthrobacter sp. Z7-10]
MELTRKKFLAGVGGTGVLALALAACGGAKTSSTSSGGKVDGAGKTLVVLMSVKSQYPQEQQTWFKQMGEKFKQQTGAGIQWETFPSANDEMTRIQTSVVSGQGPDVYGLGTTFTPTAYSTSAFVKLGDAEWNMLGGKDKFVPAALGISGPDDSNQIGIPFVSRPFVMAYNTELLKKAGIDKPATTWDDLGAQARKLTSGDQYGLAIAYKDNFDPWKFIWGMSIQAGNKLIDGKSAKIADPTVKTAYETYFGWLTKDHVVDPASIGWSNSQALAAFADGKAAYFPMTSPLSIPTLEKSAVKGKYKYALMPMVPPGATTRPEGGVEAASILSGDNLVIADYSKQKDLAFAFVKMITDTAVQADYYKTFGELPANAEAAKALQSDPVLAPALEAASKSVATPFSGAWGDVQLALVNIAVQSIPDLASGGVSDADLSKRLQDAQAKSQTSLDRAK